MSISSEIRRAGPFAGNGSTVNFPFTFKVFNTAQVLVTRTVSGVETVLTLTTDYTVSLNSNQDTSPGGTVTMLVAPATGQSITITSNVANLQPTVLANLGGFYPEVINDSLDRATIQIQQLDERVDRALTIPVSSSGIDTELPPPEADAIIGWNAGATELINLDPDNLALGLTYGSWTYQKYTGTGSQTAFVLPAVIASKHNVFITINGLTQVPETDYSITGSTINFVTAPALADEILVRWGSTRYESDIVADAELARDRAEEWAQNAEDVPVLSGQFSALHHAAKADDARAAAVVAQTAAELAETNAETAETGAVAARLAAEAARDAAQLSKGIFESTAAALGNGVQGHGAITGGSGGTDGTFPLITSGGTQVVPVRGTFVVAGGVVTQINVYYPGYYSSNPTGFDFSASSGLTSASATPTMGVNAGVGEYFSVPSTTPDELILYKVTAGPAATEVLRYPSVGAITVLQADMLTKLASVRFEALIDDLPETVAASVKTNSLAPLLVGYPNGVEFDFSRPRNQVAYTKVNGVFTAYDADDLLSVTNDNLPTITLPGGATAKPRHNLFLNSTAPVIGDSPGVLTVGVSYTIYITGSGSLTIIRPLVSGGASIGTVTEASPLTFTALDNRVRISAITGNVNTIQLQRADAEVSYISSGASVRYGVAISERVANENALLVDAAATQQILLTLSSVPALGSEWLFYFDCYSDTLGASGKNFFAFDNNTGIATYLRLGSQGLVTMRISSVDQFSGNVRTAPAVNTRFEFVVRVKDQEVIFSSQGEPAGSAGSRVSNVFTPTRLNVGTWAGASTGPPGKLHIRRFALLPV